VDGPGWRWAFLLNVPLAALTIALATRSIPETRDAHAARRLDIVGCVYAVVGLAAGTWALTESALLPGILGVAAMAAFVWHVMRAPEPLVPPQLFRVRTFTVINVMTVQLYAAIGVAFFLVAYQLQVAAKWSALASGTALLPTTLLMMALSARSGELGQRIGPRLQLIVGPLVAGAGLLLLARIGEDPSWLRDVLPGSIVFGFGLVTFVAPLTATVMASADPDHVSIASGVNNAVARTASLGALALIPVLAGLTDAMGAGAVTHAFRMAMVIAAATAASAALTALVGLHPAASCARSARRYHCHLDGPPLQVKMSG
jgi:MFS family permease